MLIYIFLYSITAKLSTELCESTDVTSSLGSNLLLSESIECESLTSEVESKTELGNEKKDYSEPKGPYTDNPLADEN